MSESETLKAIKAHMMFAAYHRSKLREITDEICNLMDLPQDGDDHRDVASFAHGNIGIDELLLRIRNRKLDQLASKIAEEGE